MRNENRQTCLIIAFGISAAFCSSARSSELKILLPQNRDAFQTNESIDLAVVRRAPQSLPAGELSLTLSSEDGSRFTCNLPTHAAVLEGTLASTTEHLHLNGWLLRPGKYKVEIASDGATAAADIELFSHLRKSSFKLVNWGGAGPGKQLPQGEDSFGFNLAYAGNTDEDAANLIRAGVDFMGCCVMSGGHQMDLRQECDWSDPYVLSGGNARVARWAMGGRTRPNVPGVHFYDEPGLTWEKDPATGESTPHNVPAQKQSYNAAFGHDPIAYRAVDPSKPDDVAAWKQWAIWKLSFMDAAWKLADFSVQSIRPDFINATQSQYGWTAFTDGYYFNVTRSLPVVSGHGGYDDYGAGYFNAAFFLEMSRARNTSKPDWYLPTWYGNTPSDRFRMEQYLSFMTGIQGMATPPDLDPAKGPEAMQGIIESNHLMARLGTIFTTMSPTREPIGLLYSLSNVIDLQSKDRNVEYAHSTKHGQNLQLMYLALKRLQQPMNAVVDEDIIDGSVAANQKVVILTSIEYLDPPVVKGLEDFIQHGGIVLKTSDTTAKVNGAIDLGTTPVMPDAAVIDKLVSEKKYQEAAPYETLGKQFEAIETTITALKSQLAKAGVSPAMESDNPGIAASRQAQGDVEYLFAVNAAYDAKEGKLNSAQVAEATLSLADDQRPVYDAIHGGVAAEFRPAQDKKRSAHFRFGIGEMRAFARTAAPIAGVRVATPSVVRDLTLPESPIRLELSATVMDDKGGIVSGAIPLRIRVTDSLGAVRYDLYRATNLGSLSLTLPLAANDPAGQWTISVEELLAGMRNERTFDYRPAARCGALAGATRRAVAIAGETNNLFRFARTHHDVTIVKGSSAFDGPAAERIKSVLAPWDVRCTIVNAADVNHSRSLSEQEARTWVGLDGGAKPGPQNPPSAVGFAINGPTILLGNPDDNPLIRYLLDARFLPYKPDKAQFPGQGRGYLAWQRDGISRGEESVTAIAYDADGMAEAVGSLYEAFAGLEPLTKWIAPTHDSLSPATSAVALPGLKVTWRTVLPDRIIDMKVDGQRISALSEDGSLTTLSSAGQVQSQKVLSSEELAATQPSPADKAVLSAKDVQIPGRVVKQIAQSKDLRAVNYWGGTIRVIDAAGAVKFQELLPQDASAIAWSGDTLLVGLSTGELLALHP